VFRPRTTSKNLELSRVVTGAIVPVPTGRWSMRITAVICAAVPVRMSSSSWNQVHVADKSAQLEIPGDPGRGISARSLGDAARTFAN
jgi:hypothetical protein